MIESPEEVASPQRRDKNTPKGLNNNSPRW